LVVPHGPHVGADALAGLHLEFLFRDAVSRLHHLGVE
jgi:hypothetical protein